MSPALRGCCFGSDDSDVMVVTGQYIFASTLALLLFNARYLYINFMGINVFTIGIVRLRPQYGVTARRAR